MKQLYVITAGLTQHRLGSMTFKPCTCWRLVETEVEAIGSAASSLLEQYPGWELASVVASPLPAADLTAAYAEMCGRQP